MPTAHTNMHTFADLHSSTLQCETRAASSAATEWISVATAEWHHFSSSALALMHNGWQKQKGRFLSYECVLQVKGDCGNLFWLQNPHYHPTTSSLLVLYCPLNPFPGSTSHSSTCPIHPSFIHYSDHRALTSKSLFTHHPMPWMSCSCWMCHWH